MVSRLCCGPRIGLPNYREVGKQSGFVCLYVCVCVLMLCILHSFCLYFLLVFCHPLNTIQPTLSIHIHYSARNPSSKRSGTIKKCGLNESDIGRSRRFWAAVPIGWNFRQPFFRYSTRSKYIHSAHEVFFLSHTNSVIDGCGDGLPLNTIVINFIVL